MTNLKKCRETVRHGARAISQKSDNVRQGGANDLIILTMRTETVMSRMINSSAVKTGGLYASMPLSLAKTRFETAGSS